MKDTGKMISNMEKVLKYGRKDRNMKETIIWEESREKGNTYGLMVQSIQGIGLIIESVAMGYTCGKMGDVSMDNGKIMTWKDSGSIIGVMVEAIKDSITMIRRVGMGSTFGPTEESMRDGGLKGNSMVWVCILIQRSKRSSMDSGKTGRD